MTQKISPTSILTGLTTIDRPTLATLLAVFEDSRAISIISDKIGTFADGAKEKYLKWKNGEASKTQERFSARVQETATKIEESEASDDCLRMCLWAHIRDSFGLDPRIAISPRDLKNTTNDVSSQIVFSIARKLEAEKSASLSKLGTKYWKKLLGKVNPFSKNEPPSISFDDAIRHAIFSLLGVILQDENAEPTHKEEILSALKKDLAGIDKKILEEAGVESLTDDAIKKLLARGGGLIGLMGAVELAGFGAYILAAQASAIIPLVGGKTLISALFVMSHPLFVFPVLLAAGAFGANALIKTIRQAFAVTVSSLLAIQGIEPKKQSETNAATFFFHSDKLISETLGLGGLLRPPQPETYHELGSRLTSEISFPSEPNISPKTRNYLETSLNDGEEAGRIESFLFPDTQNADAKFLGGLVLGDFLFDLSAIDPKVLEAADFSHNADLSGPFDFAIFAEKISGLSVASRGGHEANLMGYTAERIVASRLTENGHIVSIPDNASQARYDLIVDGKEFQVKCIEPDNIAILERHFEKYPDTPVIANAELANKISDQAPDWADKVFFLEGYTHEFANDLTKESLKAGAELGDYELLPFIAAISAARNIHGWWKGQQSLKESAFNVTIDSASKGIMAVTGGFVGTGLGMLVFGPAGAYVFGGVGAVSATIKSHWVSDRVDTVLDPDRDSSLGNAANKLLTTCVEHLEAKVLGIESKMASLPKGEIAEEFRYRWQWEMVFVQSKINEANRLHQNKTYSGERKTIAALELASQCGVHPAWLQVEYTELLNLLNTPKDRLKKTKERLWGRTLV